MNGDKDEDPSSASPGERPGELDGLATLEYENLRALARLLRRRAIVFRGVPGTESLVHEAYLRLKSSGHENWHDRSHFMAVVALQLRHLVVDYARAQLARKRGGGEARVSLDENVNPAPKPLLDVLALDEALQRLARRDERQHRVAELRLFGGLSAVEIAAVLALSERTIRDDWRQAKTFLASELRSGSGGAP